MKSDQIKHSLAVGPKSIQSRVYDRETGELISFVKMPLEETGLVSREALAEQPAQHDDSPHPEYCKGYAAGLEAGSISEKKPAQQQEPFGYFKPEPFGWIDCAETDEGAVALYERPPASKPWVGLTMDEITKLWDEIIKYAPGDVRLKDFAYAIEAKLREKNA